jgi:hypothetical protein
MNVVGSFIFNKAAERLLEIGPSVLPEIEHVLRNEVMPLWTQYVGHVPKTFIGVSDVLVMYFRLCKENELLQNAAEFLRALTGPLRIEAMRAINVVWLRQEPRGGIPEPITEVISEITVAGSDSESGVAKWLMRRQVVTKAVSQQEKEQEE